MITRTWRTRIDIARLEEWDRFVRERSTPMFRKQDGMLAVFHAREGDEWLTVSIWRDAAAVEALESSPSYTATAAALLATGMVLRDPVTEAFEVSAFDVSELSRDRRRA
jgi:heme-degrading monooxygenase HmoA